MLLITCIMYIFIAWCAIKESLVLHNGHVLIVVAVYCAVTYHFTGCGEGRSPQTRWSPLASQVSHGEHSGIGVES